MITGRRTGFRLRPSGVSPHGDTRSSATSEFGANEDVTFPVANSSMTQSHSSPVNDVEVSIKKIHSRSSNDSASLSDSSHSEANPPDNRCF